MCTFVRHSKKNGEKNDTKYKKLENPTHFLLWNFHKVVG